MTTVATKSRKWITHQRILVLGNVILVAAFVVIFVTGFAVEKFDSAMKWFIIFNSANSGSYYIANVAEKLISK